MYHEKDEQIEQVFDIITKLEDNYENQTSDRNLNVNIVNSKNQRGLPLSMN